MRREARLSLAAVTVLAAVMSFSLALNEGQASAACGDGGTGSESSVFCVKPTTTTTTTIPETTTTILPSTTTTVPEETTTLPEETTTTMEESTTTVIPTEVLPTVITTSTTAAEVGGIEELPFTGYPGGILLVAAISLLATGTLAIYGARRSRSEEQ